MLLTNLFYVPETYCSSFPIVTSWRLRTRFVKWTMSSLFEICWDDTPRKTLVNPRTTLDNGKGLWIEDKSLCGSSLFESFFPWYPILSQLSLHKLRSTYLCIHSNRRRNVIFSKSFISCAGSMKFFFKNTYCTSSSSTIVFPNIPKGHNKLIFMIYIEPMKINKRRFIFKSYCFAMDTSLIPTPSICL